MTDSGAHVGIDLGTTYSLVATMTDGAPRVLPNGIGEHLTPSAVSIDVDGRVLVGAPARARAATHPERTALAFKRDMGTDRSFDLGPRSMRAEELSALVLGALKHDAESALGMPIAEAVVTVPAYFGELQRRATRDACDLAGLPVERIINEPTAAALAYGLHERHRELRAVVLDLGGGTFDVTVLEIMEGVIEIQASSGNARLGGEDFVDVLTADAARRVRDASGADLEPHRLAMARLREACELAKQRLSGVDSTRIVVPRLAVSGREVDVDLELSREHAEALWAELLDRIRTPIVRALRDASATPAQIDEVLLVGGATRMPCVSRLAATLFGRLPLRTLPPDEAVALGAAVQAALKRGDAAVADMVVTDVAPFTLGIDVAERVGSGLVSGVFSPLIDRGTVLPASRVKRYATLSDNQRVVELGVYQGEHPMCSRNQKLGEYRIRDIPPRPAGEEAFDVRFTYDLNGVLDVDVTVLSTRKATSLTIEQAPGRLSEQQLSEIRSRMKSLKFHPAEALPNVTAIARAEALYAELTGPARDALAGALTQFRGVLQLQDARAIDEYREHLLALIARLR